MIIRSSQLDSTSEFDICIVGTGPAGISTALKLAKRFEKIVLLEGGSDQWTQESQDLYRGTVVGDTYYSLDQTRVRYFGGSSNHWGGRCRPLDAADFAPKPHRAKVTWPIDKADLDPYLEEACSTLDIPSFPADRRLGDSGIRVIEFRRSRGVRFGQKYRQWIEQNPRITLVLDANVTSLETDGQRVTQVHIARSEGEPMRLRAGAFVLATGGIENSRILLWSNELSNGQLIKDDSTLGKYWMEHPHYRIGEAIIIGQPPFTLSQDGGEVFFAPTLAAMLEDQSLNCGMKITKRDSQGLIADISCVAPDFGRWAASLLGKNLICEAKLRGAWEQEPLERNRIELSSEVDRLGVPRVKLFWRKSRYDVQTANKAAMRFGQFLAQTGAGRLRVDPWILEQDAFPNDRPHSGHHHMGGTRMAATPQDGIVDRNCKVFGQQNLYIAGSSVYPSAGCANPTFTIVQLALRLGDHLVQTVV
jgi:choline dehydrogenase-like flavoprotein